MPQGNNLRFDTAVIPEYKPVHWGAGVASGMNALAMGRERKAYNDAMAVMPGDQYEAARAAQGGYEGKGDQWEKERLRAMQDAQAARFASFGGNTSGYDNMRSREAAEAAATARRAHEMEMLEAKQKADEAEKQVALQEKIKDKLSPHDRIAISLLNSGIKTDSDKARAWDAYSSVRGVKGTGADIESLASLVGNQNLFFDELKKEIRPNATKAIDEIIRGNIAKGIPLSFAALAEAIGGSEPDKLKFQTQFQRIAQKHLDPDKLTTALAEIYDPQQREVYRNAMGQGQPQAAPEQITEQQFDNYLNSMTDEQLAAFMKRMGIM
jgi:hypothetical protein